jgi:hypothetical protein
MHDGRCCHTALLAQVSTVGEYSKACALPSLALVQRSQRVCILLLIAPCSCLSLVLLTVTCRDQYAALWLLTWSLGSVGHLLTNTDSPPISIESNSLVIEIGDCLWLCIEYFIVRYVKAPK